jgi:hypothetical protein
MIWKCSPQEIIKPLANRRRQRRFKKCLKEKNNKEIISDNEAENELLVSKYKKRK